MNNNINVPNNTQQTLTNNTTNNNTTNNIPPQLITPQITYLTQQQLLEHNINLIKLHIQSLQQYYQLLQHHNYWISQQMWIIQQYINTQQANLNELTKNKK